MNCLFRPFSSVAPANAGASAKPGCMQRNASSMRPTPKSTLRLWIPRGAVSQNQLTDPSAAVTRAQLPVFTVSTLTRSSSWSRSSGQSFSRGSWK